MDEEKKSLPAKTFKTILVVSLVVFIGLIWLYIYSEYGSRAVENEGTDYFNQGKYEEALQCFKKVLSEADPEDKERIQRVKKKIAKCYKQLSESKGVSPEEKLEYMKKAAENDASSLPPPKQDIDLSDDCDDGG